MADAPSPTPPTPAERPLGQRVLRNAAGAALLLLGVTSLFLPILQAVLMIVVGLLLIDLPVKGKAHRWLLRHAWYRACAAQCDAWLRRWRGSR